MIDEYLHMMGDKKYFYPTDFFKETFNCKRDRIRGITYIKFDGEETPKKPYKDVKKLEDTIFTGNYLLIDDNDEYWYDFSDKRTPNNELIKYFYKWKEVVREDKIVKILN